MKNTYKSKQIRLLWALLAVFAVIAAGCGSDGDDGEGATAADSSDDADQSTDGSDDADSSDEPTDDSDDAMDDSSDADEPVQIAYLTASAANTWLLKSREAMEAVAADNNLKLVEFDAGFDSATQQQQFQDVIASGQYGGVVLASLSGAAAQPDIEDALAAGLKVVTMNQVVGEDLTTTDSPVDGISALVFEPPLTRGERLGEVTVAACADFDPCNVVYFYGIRGTPLDEAVRLGWDSVVDGTTVNVIAEGEGQYGGPDVGLAAMQDILVANSEIDVVVGADQSMQGVELALDESDLTDVRIVGFGGSSYAINAISDGRWWGGLYGAPGTEGELAMKAMVDALAGTDIGGIDPSESVPNRGLMLPDNIGDFTAQWDG